MSTTSTRSTSTRSTRTRSAFAVTLCTLSMLAAACGSDGEAASTTTAHSGMDMSGEMTGDMTMTSEMAGMGMDMNMGDASATPATDYDDARTASFELLDSRPAGYDAVTGTVALATHDGGTTVTLELTGLETGVEYISHLHDGPCAESGGDHFQFEEGGSVMPPNEIHLLFSGDADGAGFMTAENEQQVDERARSIVVHPRELLDNKIACAEF